MNSYLHAKSAAKKWGGIPEDYIAVEEFIDGTKKAFGDVRHRAILHNTYGIWLAQELFGRVIKINGPTGEKDVTVREIAELHILEDLGFIPTIESWVKHMEIKTWMGGKIRREIQR